VRQWMFVLREGNIVSASCAAARTCGGSETGSSRMSIPRSAGLKNMPTVTATQIAPMPAMVGISPACCTAMPVTTAPIGIAACAIVVSAPKPRPNRCGSVFSWVTVAKMG